MIVRLFLENWNKTVMQIHHSQHCCWFFLSSFEGAVVDGFWLLICHYLWTLLSVYYYQWTWSKFEIWCPVSLPLSLVELVCAEEQTHLLFPDLSWTCLSSNRMHLLSGGGGGFLIAPLPPRLGQVLSSVTPKLFGLIELWQVPGWWDSFNANYYSWY